MRAEELLQFIGRGWRIERVIDDNLRGESYAFTGRTRGRLVERGRLSRGAETWFARRAYRFTIKGDHVVVRFEDSREFFSVDCGRLPRAEFVHECAPDVYRGALVLESAGWTLEWRVTGPAKNLTIKSRYR